MVPSGDCFSGLREPEPTGALSPVGRVVQSQLGLHGPQGSPDVSAPVGLARPVCGDGGEPHVLRTVPPCPGSPSEGPAEGQNPRPQAALLAAGGRGAFAMGAEDGTQGPSWVQGAPAPAPRQF